MLPPPILQALPLVFGQNVTAPPPGFPPNLSSGFGSFTADTNYVLYLVTLASVNIARALLAVLVTAGAILWAGHIRRHLGISFIEGAVGIVVLFEWVLPYFLQTPPLL